MILREATEIKFMYELGDQLLGSGAEMVKQRIAEYQELATLALDGRDPFITARDATVEGLQAMEARMAQLTEMADMSGSAEEKAQAVLAMCDDALVAIETLALPDVEIPEAELEATAFSPTRRRASWTSAAESRTPASRRWSISSMARLKWPRTPCACPSRRSGPTPARSENSCRS